MIQRMKYMLGNLKLGKKLVLSYIIIILIFVSCLGVAFNCAITAKTNLEIITGKSMQNIEKIWSARRSMVSIERDLYKAASTMDATITKQRMESTQKELDSLVGVITFLNENYLGDKQEVEDYNTIMTSTIPIKEKIYEFLLENKNEEAIQVLEQEYMIKFAQAGDLLVNMAQGAQNRAEVMEREATSAVTITLIYSSALVAFAIIITIILCRYIVRSIITPVNEIEKAMTSISEGNIEEAIVKYESEDELGLLASNIRVTIKRITTIIYDLTYGLSSIAKGDFTVTSQHDDVYVGSFAPLRDATYKIINNLSYTLNQINIASTQVAAGSNQMASGAQALSDGALEQASAIEELATSISNIADQVKQNSNNASSARDKASGAGTKIIECNQKMKQMITAMEEINDKSNKIGLIIKTIEDIAFQTNILALNAAIEAARAGDAGSGFAVVADEVRNLASRCAEAAKDTTVLIQESITAVENGTMIADDTAKSILTVVDKTNEVVHLVEDISDASALQACSIDQFTTGIDQVSAIVQTNSATAEESAAASEELYSQAQLLKDLVVQFQLKEYTN